MNKKEVTEIKKLFTPQSCSITRICGCYVDGDKNKKTEYKEAFLSLPEEEMFKYFEILRQSLTGPVGKYLLNLEFPVEAEKEGGQQDFLLRLRDSRLKDNDLLEEFYDRIIESYDHTGNYLILVIHDCYDVPGIAKDGTKLHDASEEVYDYILACICPVDLSKPGLNYNAAQNAFQNRVRDWVVGAPETSFIFPAFNQRSADVHSTLYYSKDTENLHDNFVHSVLGCPVPLSVKDQNKAFQAFVSDLLGCECSFNNMKKIYDSLTELAEEHQNDPEVFAIDKNAMKSILMSSEISEELMEEFDTVFDTTIGSGTSLLLPNILRSGQFEIKSELFELKMEGEYASGRIEEKIVDGKRCLVIDPSGTNIEVNGILTTSSANNS